MTLKVSKTSMDTLCATAVLLQAQYPTKSLEEALTDVIQRYFYLKNVVATHGVIARPAAGVVIEFVKHNDGSVTITV